MGRYLDMARAVPDPEPSPAAALRSLAQPAALADVAAYVAKRCCRSPRAWVELDRLHGDYVACGGRLDRAVFLSALLADKRCGELPGGIIACLGLAGDWGAEDNGRRQLRQRGERNG